jgi:hypothetical protein
MNENAITLDSSALVSTCSRLYSTIAICFIHCASDAKGVDESQYGVIVVIVG